MVGADDPSLMVLSNRSPLVGFNFLYVRGLQQEDMVSAVSCRYLIWIDISREAELFESGPPDIPGAEDAAVRFAFSRGS